MAEARIPHPDLPPPVSIVGPIGWLRRNLFSSPLNIAADPAGPVSAGHRHSATAALDGAERNLERRHSRRLPGQQRGVLGVYPGPF
jgi:hypothetical protein